jgi:transposase
VRCLDGAINITRKAFGHLRPFGTGCRIDTGKAALAISETAVDVTGRQVSATAKKHGVSRSQLYRWRQLAQACNLGSIRLEGFVPVQITPEAPAPVAAASNPVIGQGRMEAMSANGRRVIVERDVDGDALLSILRGLETLR